MVLNQNWYIHFLVYQRVIRKDSVPATMKIFSTDKTKFIVFSDYEHIFFYYNTKKSPSYGKRNRVEISYTQEIIQKELSNEKALFVSIGRILSFCYFIYSINRNTIGPVCGPSTHFACEEGPHKSIEFTLLRTGGITFKTEIPLSGSV